VDETPYRLAYEASVRAIEDQARVLEDLRSRAATLVAAAALVTSFLGGTTLTRSSAIEARSWTGVAFAAFLLAAASSLAVLWPVRLRFSVSAGEMLELVHERQQTSTPVTPTEALGELAIRLELMYDGNAPRIQALLWVFRLGILFLSIEVAAWTVALWRL
jgi:hypothetical protein